MSNKKILLSEWLRDAWVKERTYGQFTERPQLKKKQQKEERTHKHTPCRIYTYGNLETIHLRTYCSLEIIVAGFYYPGGISIEPIISY